MRKVAVAYATESLGLSERKACQLTGISPSVYRYRSQRCDDGDLRLRMRELAASNSVLVFSTARSKVIRPWAYRIQ